MTGNQQLLAEKLGQIGGLTFCPIIAIVREGKILTGLRNYTKDKWKDVSVWTLPGGRSDAGETIEQTLRREVAEETGITDFLITGFVSEVSGAKEGDTVLQFVGESTQEPKLMEPEKFSEWRWIDAKEYLNGPLSSFNPRAAEALRLHLGV